MTGLLLTVFLIGAFSSNRSTGLAHVPCLYSIGKPNPPDILSSGGNCPMFYGKPTFFSTNFYLDDNCQIGQSECLAVNRAFSLADATLFKPEEA